MYIHNYIWFNRYIQYNIYYRESAHKMMEAGQCKLCTINSPHHTQRPEAR